jgi:antitoxin CcdA
MPKAPGCKDDPSSTVGRRATNVSLDAELLRQAKALGVNISRACERGLALEVAATSEKLWLDENGPALDAANAFVEAQGLPLARHRKF